MNFNPNPFFSSSPFFLSFFLSSFCTNFLIMETGRYEEESVEEHLCRFFDEGEDEKHFLLDRECTLIFEALSGRNWSLANFWDAKKLEGMRGSVHNKDAAEACMG